MIDAAIRLKRAYALIQDKSHWCRGVPYRNLTCDTSGMNTMPTPHVQQCLQTAIGSVCGGWINSPLHELVEAQARELFGSSIIGVNDHFGHRAATMILRRAILLAEGTI